MLSKSDVGTYTYAPPGSPRPHAVMGISGSTVSTTFTYDPVGNQTAGLGRTITWTSYNKPASITQGTKTVSFLDGTDHQRFKQISPDGTTLYIKAFGVTAELVAPGTTAATWNDYLSVGNVNVGMRSTQVTPQTVTTRYFHVDHLGSIGVITNENGAVVERLSFDAWGKRRFPNGADDAAGSIESLTTRGFTSHEQLDSVALVHMNGRVYDPLIARMISADPTVPDPMNAQAWNRYSYVGNDPLAFTDPSGFSWLSNFFHSVANTIRSLFERIPILRSIIQIVATTIASLVCGPCAIAVAALTSAVLTGLSGGKLGDMLKAGAIAGATALAFWGAGDLTGMFPGTLTAAGGHGPLEFGSQAYLFSIASHSGIGCLSSVASGGKCGPGALSGGVSAAATPLVNMAFENPRGNAGDFIGGTAASGLVGGLASVAGGGKFENGAVTGAFGYMFNAAAGRALGQQFGSVAGTVVDLAAGYDRAALIARLAGGAIGSAIEDLLFPSTPPDNAWDTNGPKAPGYPGRDPADGGHPDFKEPKGGPDWVPNPNGRGNGWRSANGDVWVPTGKGGSAHGQPHWDVQFPKEGYTNALPGGGYR